MARFLSAAPGWPQPDFLPRPAKPPALAWLALLVVSVVLALAVDEWVALQSARQQVDAQVSGLPALPARERRAADARPRPGGPEQAQLVAGALVHPWRDLFESSERHAARGIRWLRLDHDAERGSVRLDGVAPDRRAVLATLESLAADPRWSDVLLLRIESTAPEEAAESGVRFELRARLGAAAREEP